MALFPPSYLKIRIRKIRCSFLGGARFETGKHGSTRGIVFTAVNISVFRWLRKNKSVWIMEIRYRTLILILGQFCFDFDRPKISTNLKSVNSFGVYPLKTIKHVRPFWLLANFQRISRKEKKIVYYINYCCPGRYYNRVTPSSLIL